MIRIIHRNGIVSFEQYESLKFITKINSEGFYNIKVVVDSPNLFFKPIFEFTSSGDYTPMNAHSYVDYLNERYRRVTKGTLPSRGKDLEINLNTGYLKVL